MSNHQIEIALGVFCEIARLEKTGQVSAIGIWGTTCLVDATTPPVTLSSLAFLAQIANPDHHEYRATLTVSFPGVPAPVVNSIEVTGEKLKVQDAQNFILQMFTPNILEFGDIVATVHLETDPPVEQEFRLAIQPSMGPKE